MLAKLLAESGEGAGVATPATPATPKVKSSKVAKVARAPVPDTGAIRGRLLAVAATEYRDAGLVRALGDAFLRECGGYSDAQLRALLSMLADDAERKAGRAPAGDTAAVLCQHCGPVFLHPSIVAVLPVVGGWPRALGCPWCFIRAAGGYIPRPRVVAAACAHWIPDAVNPSGGRGQCRCGPWWPAELHGCKDFRPKEPTP